MRLYDLSKTSFTSPHGGSVSLPAFYLCWSHAGQVIWVLTDEQVLAQAQRTYTRHFLRCQASTVQTTVDWAGLASSVRGPERKAGRDVLSVLCVATCRPLFSLPAIVCSLHKS